MKSYSALFNNNRGSFGNVTATAGPEGSTILKSRIRQTTNPNTLLQQAQRTIFRELQHVGSSVNSFLKERFTPFRPAHSPYNSFLSAAIKKARTMATYSLIECLKLVQYVNGGLYKVPFTVLAGASYNVGAASVEADIEWSYQAGSPNQDGTDKLFAITYEPSTGNSNVIDCNKTRSVGSATLTIPATSGQDVVIVLYFQAANGLDQMDGYAEIFKNAANVVTVL